MKLKGSHTVSILRLEDPAAFSMDLVASRAFDADLKDGTDTPVSGFVSCLDPLVADPLVQARVGQYFIFSLRYDQKKVPAPMLRLAVAEAVREREMETGRRLSRVQKKEIRENVRLALVRRMGYSSTVTDFAFDPETGLLLAFEGPGRKLDAVVAAISELGCAVRRDYDIPLGDLFVALCQESVDVDGYHFSDAGAVTLVGDKGEEMARVTASNAEEVVMNAMDHGYAIQTMRLRVDDPANEEFCAFAPAVGDFGLALKSLTFSVPAIDLPPEGMPLPEGEGQPAQRAPSDGEEADLILLLESVIMTARLFERLVGIVERGGAASREGG